MACLHLMHAETSTSGERILFALPLGLGVMAYGILGLGLMGLLSTGPVLIFLAFLLLIALPQVQGLFRLPRAQAAPKPPAATVPPSAFLRDQTASPKTLLTWRITGLAGGLFLVFFLLVGVLAPPSSNEWDSLSYHLAAPKIYLNQHAIRYLPFIHQSNFPFTLEMLYALGLLLDGTALAKSFHFLCALLSALGIYLFGQRFFSEEAGILGALAFLSIPNVAWEATTAYIDLGTACFTFLSIYALVGWQETRKPSWLLLSGTMMGLALGTKMFALATLFLSAVWIVAACARMRYPFKRGSSTLMRFAIPAILIAMPWYLKSFLMTGNPVYPFYYSIFGGRNWSAENAAVYRQAQLQFGLGRDLPSLLLLPWNLLLHSDRFFDSPVAFATLGPLPLGFLWIMVFGKKLHRIAASLLGYSGIFLLFWFLQMQQVRYLLVILPLLLIAGAQAVIANWKGWRFIRVGVAGFVAGGILFGMYVTTMVNSPMLAVAFGAESKEAYLSRTLDVYDALQAVNRLPYNAKVIFFHEARGFYCDREYCWGNPGHHTMIPYSTFKDARAMFAFLKRMGFTHVLINESFAPKDTQERWQIFLQEAPSLGLMAKIYEARRVSLYEIL